jgi:hypothetical protein
VPFPAFAFESSKRNQDFHIAISPSWHGPGWSKAIPEDWALWSSDS